MSQKFRFGALHSSDLSFSSKNNFSFFRKTNKIESIAMYFTRIDRFIAIAVSYFMLRLKKVERGHDLSIASLSNDALTQLLLHGDKRSFL